MTTGRRAILKVLWGKAASQKIVIQKDQSIRVGRGEEAELCLAHDRKLSSTHLWIDFTGSMLRVRDAASHSGTTVDGAPFTAGAVDSGAVIAAGDTVMRLFIERHTPPSSVDENPERVAQARSAFSVLQNERSLYGVFDAARDPRVTSLIDESVDEAWSLYEGDAGDAMADVAPYLVRFRADSDLLAHLVAEGWGLGWGIYFAADRPVKEVRRHLRRFLMVQAEDTRERLYFRFYDPRVLRDFLPMATPRQRSELFGDLSLFLFEDEKGALRRVDPLAVESEDTMDMEP
jgi:hypothetical protein